MRILSVRLSVSLSIKRVDCDITEKNQSRPYERSFCPVFWEKEWLVSGDPFYLKFCVNRPRWSEIADFRTIFARSASAVTPSDKSSINTNRKSRTRFPMSPRWTSYTLSPKRWLKNAVSKIWTISCDNSETVRDSMSDTINQKKITNRKLHTGFRLIPTSMTLNDLERRNSPYFAFFHRIRLICWPITS